MNEPLVTILTPAYNMENYIVACIESVLNQTYGNFEWILIDNGSTDNTREIIQEYAQKDKRIKAVRFERNTRGFSNDMLASFSRGKYVTKLDSDDFWDSRYLEKLINEMENNEVDLVCCKAMVLDEANNQEYCYGVRRYEGLVIPEELEEQYREIESDMDVYWAKLMKRDLFIKACDAQREFYRNRAMSVGWGVDTIFMYFYLNECRAGMFLKDILYFYRLHKENGTKTVVNLKALENCRVVFDIKKDLLQKFRAWNEKNKDRVYGAFWGSIDTFLRNIIQSDMWDNEQKIERMGEILSDVRVLELRREYMPDNAWMILRTHIAWCYIHMKEGCESVFLKMLVVLEPEIFCDIKEEQYWLLLAEKTLLPLIIMGEKEEALQHLQKRQLEGDGRYDEIYNMLINLGLEKL